MLDEVTYHRLSLKFGTVFEAGIGAEAINKVFESIDLPVMEKQLAIDLEKASAVERAKIQKRFNLVKSIGRAGVSPEWMFLKNIPVIPPALRPMVALDGGRHATSDVNDLYRRVINRNNRLKKLLDLNAPDVILRNEKRILQEAVDALIDNSIRKAGGEGVMNQAQRRPLKSLADSCGVSKVVSARTFGWVTILAVRYCGWLELKNHSVVCPSIWRWAFRPFVIAKILEQELAFVFVGLVVLSTVFPRFGLFLKM